MKILFTDNNLYKSFYPISLTRPIAEIRFGILTFRETWERIFLNHHIQIEVFYQTELYLSEKYPSIEEFDFMIAGNIKATEDLYNEIMNLKVNESLYIGNEWIASKKNSNQTTIKKTIYSNFIVVNKIWELFQKNELAIQYDFEILTKNRISSTLSSTNQFKNNKQIFIEEGAKVELSILIPLEGYIYIGKNAEVMEGSIIRGSLALCEGATLKMGAKVYGATTIGPFCKVGGEVSNSIFQAYSNKGHDGFIGNSIIGEWCNLGADTNSSNLKNNYGFVKIYNFITQKMEQTDITFCGLLIGDHSKTGINTMLNTATTIGVSSNIYGADFPPKYIPSFKWGSAQKMEEFDFVKSIEVAINMMKRRNITLSNNEIEILKYISDNQL